MERAGLGGGPPLVTRGIWALRSALRYPSLLGSTAALIYEAFIKGGRKKKKKKKKKNVAITILLVQEKN